MHFQQIHPLQKLRNYQSRQICLMSRYKTICKFTVKNSEPIFSCFYPGGFFSVLFIQILNLRGLLQSTKQQKLVIAADASGQPIASLILK